MFWRCSTSLFMELFFIFGNIFIIMVGWKEKGNNNK